MDEKGSGERPGPWQFGYCEAGQELVSDKSSLQDALTSNIPAILQHIQLTEQLWHHLLQLHVLDEDTKNRIQSKKTERAKAFSLVNHLMESEVYRLHGFIWVLVNTKQCHIAQLLGFDVNDYFDMDLFMTSSSLKCPACSELYSRAYIMTACDHYVCRPCLKGAKFQTKDYRKEDILCPVPKCEKVSEARLTGADICLDEDETFGSLCEAIRRDVNGAGECGTCKTPLTIKHHCYECAKDLCPLCTDVHRKDQSTHPLQHCHQADFCCTHVAKAEIYCDKCDVYRCASCTKCAHKTNSKTNREMAEVKAKLMERIEIIKTNEAYTERAYGLYKEVLESNREGVENYIRYERDKIKQWADTWAREKIDEYAKAMHEVKCNLHRSTQWQKVARDLEVLQNTRPWLLHDKDGAFPAINVDVEPMSTMVQSLILELKSGFFMPAQMRPPSYALIPPTKASLLMESKIPAPSFWCDQISWTPDGSLLVATREGIWRLDIDLETKVCQSTLTLEDIAVEDICQAEDGTLAICLNEEGVIEIHDPKGNDVRRWKPTGIKKPKRLAINKTHLYVMGEDSPVIKAFKRNTLEKIEEYDLGRQYSCGYIHVTDKRSLVATSSLEGMVYRVDLGSKEVTKFNRKGKSDKELDHPTGVWSVCGGEYLLVCDYEKSCLNLFSDAGHFLHRLDVEEGVCKPWNIVVYNERGKAPVMALFMEMDEQDILRFYKLE